MLGHRRRYGNQHAGANSVRSEQFGLCSYVVSYAAGIDSAERSQFVGVGSCVENVKDWQFSRDDRIGDQRAMTAPRHCLGAHDDGGLEPGESDEIVQRILKLARLHVVGVGAEAGILPESVARVAPPPAATAQRWHVCVAPAGVDNRSLELRPGEVRVSRGCGKGANIDQMRRAFSCKQSEKLLERSGRMPDCVKPSGVHAPRNCRLRRAAFPKAE
jgi:hypothetical protein